MAKQRVRHSIQELESRYNNNEPLPLETVIRAFKGIQELDPSNDDSFFCIAGFHGEPFRTHEWPEHDKTDYVPPQYWGGYCNHANVLFPTWHRAYLLRLENAMRRIPGCEDVTLPFWDECFDETKPLPKILTSPKFKLDGELIPNPLYSYKLQRGLKDEPGKDLQTKPKDYETCRFPFSGLVGTDADKKATAEWNARFVDSDENIRILNGNISNWLKGDIKIIPEPDDQKTRLPKDLSAVKQRYVDCLNAPNYTLFSNTQSADEYNKPENRGGKPLVIALESPHNSIHLAVGGFFQKGNYKADPEEYKGANGDMGENETASMDPIFFLHHCYVDYIFWRWQLKHGATQRGSLEIIKYYPGSNSGAYATPNIPPYTNLTLQTPLYPFRKDKNVPDSWYTSDDVTDIVNDLHYTYGVGTMDQYSSADTLTSHATKAPAKVIRAHGINRAQIKGSFVVRTYVRVPGEGDDDLIEVGKEAILSRWNVDRCANCQVTLPVQTFTGLSDDLVNLLEKKGVDLESSVEVALQTHSDPTSEKFLSSGPPKGVDKPKFDVS